MDFIWVHLIIAVLLTAYFLYRFIKDREIYQLMFVIWIPSTLLTYLSTNAIFRYILIAFQIVMFILVLYFMFRKPKPQTLGNGEDQKSEPTGETDSADAPENSGEPAEDETAADEEK